MGSLDGESSAEIEAPIEAVWAVVEDVERAPSWQGGMKSIRAVERDDEGRALLCEVEVDARVRALGAKIRFDYGQAPRRLAWHSESGDIKSIIGAWELDELDGGRTRATYSTEVDLGRTLGMLIRGPIVGVLRDQLAGARADELKREVEGG